MTTMKWQPIDTAPKDGTAVLVMRDIWPGTVSGRAEECNGHNTYVAAWWGGERDGAGAWVCYMDAVRDPECPIEPTHWMPLPEPPSESSAQVKREPPKGCRIPLAKGQYWAFCGETDMGQTDPALCTECGGEFKRRDE